MRYESVVRLVGIIVSVVRGISYLLTHFLFHIVFPGLRNLLGLFWFLLCLAELFPLKGFLGGGIFGEAQNAGVEVGSIMD